MKRSPSSLEVLAAATLADTFSATATMSFRPLYSGHRTQWRKSFSDQPNGDRSDQIVTGDSHFKSVRDANRGFRPREGGISSNFHGQSRPPPSNSRPTPPLNYRHPLNAHAPAFNPNQSFWPQQPPTFGQNQHFNQSQHLGLQKSPVLNQNKKFRPPQQFRVRPPKPLDYRNWEYAKPRPPPEWERFTILSYNILADYLAINHRSKLYFHIPRHMLDWEWRKRNIVFELGLWSTDILCFQEVDKFQDLEEELKRRGYNGIWKMRTGEPVDGCAIFWRTSRFKLLHEESIEFNKLGLRDNVAQICVFESLNLTDSSFSQASSVGSNKVVICNIHVLYNPKRGEIKLGQIRVLLDRAYSVSKLWDDTPVVICGDFNCTPKSPVYNFISEQKLNVSELPRDKVSGQDSAEIHPSRPFIPNVRAQPADEELEAPTLIENREGAVQNDSSTDMLKEDVLKCSSERNEENECGLVSNKTTKATQQGTEDDYKNVKNLYVQVGGLKGTPSSTHDESGCSTDKMKCEIHEYAPAESSHENNYSNVNKTERRKDMHGQPDLLRFSSNENSQLDPDTGNENINAGKLNASANDNCPESATDFNLDVPFSKLEHETSFPGVLEVSSPVSSGNSSSLSVANIMVSPSSSHVVGFSDEYERVDILLDEMMEKLPLDEQDESTAGDETFCEDSSSFLSELHSNQGGFPSNVCGQTPVSSNDEVQDDFPGLDSSSIGMGKATYDPSAWTSVEIQTATGSSDCTLMDHPLKLRSTYSEVEDCSGTRDANGEPLVTSYHRRFLGTVDYIWHTEDLQTVKVLAPMPKHAMQWTPGFPTKKWGSDHIALVSELAFAPKDVSGTQNAEPH